jgi:6-pyruvoyltetrahydropterin/6-carboxytetrahydropterin synthase
MARISIARAFTIACAHALYGHEGRCRNIHGHNYKIVFTVTGSQLDDVGRIVDFGRINQLIGGWLKDTWDHAMLVYRGNGDLVSTLADCATRTCVLDFVPSAENMALFLLETVCPELLRGEPFEVTKVRVWESETSYAEACLD